MGKDLAELKLSDLMNLGDRRMEMRGSEMMNDEELSVDFSKQTLQKCFVQNYVCARIISGNMSGRKHR